MPDLADVLALALTVDDFKPFVLTGLALGAVYALSATGIVVLYQATGVLNLAFGAVGALGALVSWELVNSTGIPEWPCYLACVGVGAVVTLLYGVTFGRAFAARDPLVKAIGTLGLALILLGAMYWIWPAGTFARSLIMPTTNWGFDVGFLNARLNGTQLIAFCFTVLVTAGTWLFLRYTNLGTAMRALANDREIAATLGVPVRRVEAYAWLGSGLLCGASGLLLANLVGLDAGSLTFLVISALAAALIARLRSIWVTLLAGIGIGLAEALATPIFEISRYRTMAPFVLAIAALLIFQRQRVMPVARTAR
ncbi:MAG TPA: branched-chain amino acid ABC transporter permease [Gaiellaceae bacterium]|jgi:branched-chain amino acid transport system permease protein